MNTALVERKENGSAPTVTSEQLELVKKTVAAGATDAELKLYLFDCARQGVHPLDKLIHFTKRGGKYTPITSIDFMRIRAAETNEYAGSDDAAFDELADDEHPKLALPLSATVTVWRLVQGTRCSFTATARWSEYKPAENDFMWKRMPYTMLAKCAEALALRKGFPRQLAGLYAKEEMDQAGPTGGYVVDAPAQGAPLPAAMQAGRDAASLAPSVPNGGDSGALYAVSVSMQPTKNANVKKHVVVLSDGRMVTTIKEQLGALAEQCCQERTPITVETKTTKWGEDLTALHRVQTSVAGADGYENHIDDDPDLSF